MRLAAPATSDPNLHDKPLPAQTAETFQPHRPPLPTCAYVLLCATRCTPSAAVSTTQQRSTQPTKCWYTSAPQASTAAVTSRLRCFFTSEGSCFMRAAGVPGLQWRVRDGLAAIKQ